MKAVNKLIITTALAIASVQSSASILIAEFGYTQAALETRLESDGYTVDRVNALTTDAIANALNTGNYEQFFVFDIVISNYVSANDIAAINTFRTDRKSVVLDGQSYNYSVWNTGDQDGQQFVSNIADEFALFGGGLYLGYDHTNWARNASAILNGMGMDSNIGYVTGEVVSYDAASPLFDGVNPLNWRSSSYGNALVGEQGGQTFTALASTSSGDALISASFVGDQTENNAPEVPEPLSLALLSFGLVGIGMAKRKQAK